MKRIIIAITGASGSLYGIRLLEVLKNIEGIETHLIISKAGLWTISCETNYSIEDVKNLADYYHKANNIGASISSGSFKTAGMIVAPCSMKTMGCIACDVEDNLISRAANVVLKERRRLILMVRESPLHSGHLENMLKLSNWGAIIAPPMPSFYNKPSNIGDIIDHSVARSLDLLDIDHNLTKPWKES